MDPQIEVVKVGLLELYREINSGRLDGALSLAHGWSLEETTSVSSHDKGTVSDPTGNRAVNPTRKDPTEAIMRSDLEAIDQYVTDLVKLSRDTQPVTGREAHARYKSENRVVLELAPCASIACDDQAPIGRRHCDACAKYLDSRPGTTQVPRDTILTRNRKRQHDERTRIRVSGPLEGEMA